MKRHADKHRSECQFAVGDWVFLKLQPYVQSSLANRAHQKLAFRFFGPFCIIARISAVAYRLDLPQDSAIHPIFHVSQLKKSLGAGSAVASLPSDLVEFQVPLAISQRRWTGGDHPVEEGLVRWSHMPPSLSTWEPLGTLKQQFPRALAWGHVASHGGEGVSNA